MNCWGVFVYAISRVHCTLGFAHILSTLLILYCVLQIFSQREGEQCAEQPYLAVDIVTEGGRENSVKKPGTVTLTEGGRENSVQNSLTW